MARRPGLQPNGKRPQVGRPARHEKLISREYKANLRAKIIELYYQGRSCGSIALDMELKEWWVRYVVRAYYKQIGLTLAANVDKR